jgi:hypothetical protein
MKDASDASRLRELMELRGEHVRADELCEVASPLVLRPLVVAIAPGHRVPGFRSSWARDHAEHGL